jgi:hypothetical protein
MIFWSSLVDLHQQMISLVINLSLEIFFNCDYYPLFRRTKRFLSYLQKPATSPCRELDT